MLQKIVFKENIIIRVYRFPGLPRTCINFPGLFSPGKCHNEIPGLSRISGTRTNPAEWASPEDTSSKKQGNTAMVGHLFEFVKLWKHGK